MKRGATYLEGHNCQIAVDGYAQVILAEAVANQAPDQECSSPEISRPVINIQKEFVPQWPPDDSSVNHVRPKRPMRYELLLDQPSSTGSGWT